MTSRLARGLASCATVTALALGSSAPALAHGDGHNCHGPNQNGQSSSQSSQSSNVGSMPAQKTDLTGSTLDSASQAAIAAVPGGTVTKATTDPDSRITDAAYKVHVIKSDGSHVFVVEDSNFNVLAVESGHRFCHHKFGEHSHGDHVRHDSLHAHSQ